MGKYYPRVMDKTLDFALHTSGAVQITGPKWCGKSTTALHCSQSAVFMQDAEHKEQNMALAKNSPSFFLQGKTPRLIDEWQVIPFIWDQIRYEIDKRNKEGQFILTGSSTPYEVACSQITHSGIGRILPIRMRTMTLFESNDGNGTISLENLFSGGALENSDCDLSLEDYAYLVCRGGWPGCINKKREYALEMAFNFYEQLVNTDINTLFKRTKNPEKLKRFMREYSRGISSELSVASMKNDLEVRENSPFDEDTLFSYVNALERLYIIEELHAWNPNLRSKTAIRTSNTRHFVDPSIACAALGLGPEDLMNDLKTFGLLFESMCVRDLRVYTEAIHGNVYHYRDKRGHEADAVLHLRNGKWALVEVKLASSEAIDEAAKNLLQIASDVNIGKDPSFLMVMTATRYAYKRDDGVYVVPLGCLKN